MPGERNTKYQALEVEWSLLCLRKGCSTETEKVGQMRLEGRQGPGHVGFMGQ